MALILPKPLQELSDRPWLVWLMICLCRQESRQQWVEEVHDNILSKIREVGEFNGTVPNMPDWKFQYHGGGLCLSGPDNEVIDMNFQFEEGNWIDPYFFADRVINLEQEYGPEARLRFWLPTRYLIAAALRSLDITFLNPDRPHVFKLKDEQRGDWEAIKSAEIETPHNFLDWLILVEQVDTSSQESVHQEAFQNWLIKKVEKGVDSRLAFRDLIATLSPDNQLKVCKKYIKGEVNHDLANCVAALKDHENPPIELISAVLERLDPQKHHPYIAHTVCKFLLKRNVSVEESLAAVKRFADVEVVEGFQGNPYDYNLAHLTMIYLPKAGMQMMRKALVSSTPDSVHSAAALYALIDEDWSNKEVMNALDHGEFKRDTNRRYLIAALLNSKYPEVKQRGVELMPPPRKRAPGEIGYTHDDVVAASMNNMFKQKLQRVEVDLKELNLDALREAATKL